MGGQPYSYFVDYEPDIGAALRRLREREFLAGRYYPAADMFAIQSGPWAGGTRCGSIDEAREAAAESGTQSILDLDHISDRPDFTAAGPLSESELQRIFGTTRPTRKMIEGDGGFGVLEFWERIDRGMGVYVIVHENDQPKEIFFAGYSFD